MFIITKTAGPEDATGTIYLGIDANGQRREIHVGGDPVDLTPAELAMVYSTGCHVEEVADDGSDAAERAAKMLDEMQSAMPGENEPMTDDQPAPAEKPAPPASKPVASPQPTSPSSPTATAGTVPINPNVPSKGV